MTALEGPSGEKLKDRIAIITGAASGFGEAIAELFAKEGARVVIADLNFAAVSRVAARIGDLAFPVAADVGLGESIDALVGITVKKFGIPNIVVNNAGTSHPRGPLLNVDEKTFDRIFQVNVKSIFLMVQAVVPLMRQNGGGVILNTGSTAGIRPRPGLTWYNASKAAVNVLSKSLAIELAPDQIRVNALCPTLAATGLFETFTGTPDTPENRERATVNIPMGRLCSPSDVAKAALYLASDDAMFVTGIEFPIDGARSV